MSPEKRPVDPDTASVTGGHRPGEHLGSLKPPVYQTSTFVFETAEEGKRFFELVYALDEAEEGETPGYIYSRLDSPNARVAEARLAAWEGAEEALVFNSGMAAISTMLLTLLRPGHRLLHSSPIYGGTAKLLRTLFAELEVEVVAFGPETTGDDLERLAEEGDTRLILVETPANPTNDLFDIEAAARAAGSVGATLVVDNTFLSPVWQRPLEHGADIVVHSATKYLGGHSDLTAGAVCGSSEALEQIRHNRYRLGTTASPATAWLLGRSLETLRLRVEKQTDNATRIASFLAEHERVSAVRHLSLLSSDDPGFEIYKRQCRGPGAMISLEVVGGEEGAFVFLNSLEVVRLAVSLGGTESLASHPWTMSHSTLPAEAKLGLGVTPGLIRLSVGIESADDLIADLSGALDAIADR
ncbi:MAG: aminotransferase class I/II-fold pyridoxal phosphate-dependent enzyme [Actinobacteria bacterium]|nr:aminotransferase class I/II-fold pyridoxal phosphate-dependent enzyme [Actinomycetota bacterium]